MHISLLTAKKSDGQDIESSLTLKQIEFLSSVKQHELKSNGAALYPLL